MNNMEIKINLEIGMKPQMVSFLERLFGSQPGKRGLPAEPEKPRESDESDESDMSEQPVSEQPTAEPVVPVVPAEQEPAAEPVVPVVPAEQEPGTDKPYTDQELRDFMDMAISRLAGNDWRENKDPKAVAIRKRCATLFKQIASSLGAERPTMLPDEKRQQFVKGLESITLNSGGMPEWLPF